MSTPHWSRQSAIFTILLALFSLIPILTHASSAEPQSQPASQATVSPTTVGQAAVTTAPAELREQMRQIARDEISARLDAAERGAIDSAAQATRDADHTMTFVSWMTGIAAGLVGLMAFFFQQRTKFSEQNQTGSQSGKRGSQTNSRASFASGRTYLGL
jgi:hypothetical protein